MKGAWALTVAAILLPLALADGRRLRSNHDDVVLRQHLGRSIFRTPQRKLSTETDPMRRFFGDLVLNMPDLEATQGTILGPLHLNLTDFFCFDFEFDEILINLLEGDSEEEPDSFQLEVTDLLFSCTMNVSWGYGNNGGQGAASVISDKNYLKAVVSRDPAAEVTEDNCKRSKIDIDTLEFNGDLSLQVMNLYRGFIRRIVENKAEEKSCGIMTFILELAVGLADGVLDEIDNAAIPERADPLYLEHEFINPGNASIVSLEGDELAGDLLGMALRNLNSFYAERKPDPTASTGDGMDYGFNAVVRGNFTNEDSVFASSQNEMTVNLSTTLVDLRINLTNIRIHGLDTAVVTPATVIGTSTMQTHFSWTNLTIEVDLIGSVSASTHADGFIVNAHEVEPLVESMTAAIRVDSINATVSLFVPLDRAEVDDLTLGHVIHWQDLPPCIPEVLFGVVVSQLDVTVGDIHEPVVQGIESNVIQRIAQKGVQIGLVSYENRIIEVIPDFFQSTMWDAVDDILQEHHCPNETVDSVSASRGSDQGSRRLTEEEEEEEEEDFVRPTGADLYVNIICAFVCVCTAALAAGLTMGLLSLDELMLLIKERAGATEEERKAAANLLPIVRQHHLLLVSLLLMNALANEALPLFLDKLVGGYAAVVISVTLVLFFGEIIPTALFTGPNQVKLASSLAPIVRTVMFVLSPVAWPIAKILDRVLADEHDSGYNRGELTALVRIQYEEHLASKRKRKSNLKQAIKEFESMESLDTYTSQRSSGRKVHPEIRNTLRAVKRQFSRRQLMESDELHVDEVTMVEGALQMGTTNAGEVYTPWSQVFAIPSDMILNERNAVKIYRSGFSRIPIYRKSDEDADDNTRVFGILSTKRLIVVDSQDQREVATLPLTIPRCVSPHTSLVDLINIFQEGGVRCSHMALVCTRPEEAMAALKKREPVPDEAGLMGVVTLEDVLETLIQEEIYDEYDRQERKKFELARWGFQRWRRFVRNRKKRRGELNYSSITSGEPNIVRVVEEGAGKEEPSETTTLLDRLNPFS
ncbi:DUF21 domain-containing protein [Seminavis robusta]|uniref:DUF21 domain-containing protein n=1 Tax=Seminavis robusta TaxID=568900 RepID=A0A9N8E947_9STRA|nr:DUF21 domain-containing protein [Seminavis robusta]|eukprot:Sro809_g205640.1 DUF21 domain-containing protein (1039) ;mRNA; f:38715-42318